MIRVNLCPCGQRNGHHRFKNGRPLPRALCHFCFKESASKRATKPGRKAKGKEQTADKVYKFIVDYKIRNGGHSPSVAEIRVALGLSDPSAVRYNLNQLVERGLISTNERGRINVKGGRWVLDD